jgi:hypothetical protein
VVINSIIVMTRSFREVNINTDIMQGANVMDQMTRYIRKSTAITSITGGNDLLLADTVDGYSMEFRLNGTNLEYYQAGALVGNLNSSNISITSLSFTQIDTLKSKAVKISMTVKSNRYGSVRTETFYDTIVLRSTYSN